MALPTQWNPFRQQASRFDPFADIEDLVRGLTTRSIGPTQERALEMRMDVNEDDQAYRVTVDVPGVKKENIDVSVDGNQVTINAEVQREEFGENQREVHSERFIGKAFRSFSLPSELDAERAEASYDGGVLRLNLPKKGDTQSRRRLSIN